MKNIIIKLNLLILLAIFLQNPVLSQLKGSLNKELFKQIISDYQIEIKDHIEFDEMFITGVKIDSNIFENVTAIFIDKDNFYIYKADKVIYDTLNRIVEFPRCSFKEYKKNQDVLIVRKGDKLVILGEIKSEDDYYVKMDFTNKLTILNKMEYK
jgi:hypothetical protein